MRTTTKNALRYVASSGPVPASRLALGIAAVLCGLMLAGAIGGGGRAVAAICIGGGILAGLNLDHLARLQPIGRLAAILAICMALLTAGASVIDLEVAGW